MSAALRRIRLKRSKIFITKQVIDQFSSYDTKIVLGDFKPKIGKEEMFRPTIRKESLREDSNGHKSHKFCRGKRSYTHYYVFKYKDIHKAIWTSPDGAKKNQFVYFLIDKRCHTNVLDVRVYRGADSN